jgi:hypothetical protein
MAHTSKCDQAIVAKWKGVRGGRLGYVNKDAVGCTVPRGDEHLIVAGGHAWLAGRRIAPAQRVPPVSVDRLGPLDRVVGPRHPHPCANKSESQPTNRAFATTLGFMKQKTKNKKQKTKNKKQKTKNKKQKTKNKS